MEHAKNYEIRFKIIWNMNKTSGTFFLVYDFWAQKFYKVV